MSTKSLILVIIQFSSFLFFGLVGNIFATKYLLILQIIGLFIGFWGIVVMKLGKFNIQPEVKNQAQLIIAGPYKIIRNPMYAGLLLFFGLSLFSKFNYLRLSVFLILTTVLILKIVMEEDFLTKRFGENYLIYKNKTYRLIPFVY